eukprot:GEZU01000880.1.p1 GENE.GEZU01000880.1~~GEZU01000880.1.p1  ORF type:complete len:377 (+),score=111.61 GEZU01000880.1:101-1231(+)
MAAATIFPSIPRQIMDSMALFHTNNNNNSTSHNHIHNTSSSRINSNTTSTTLVRCLLNTHNSSNNNSISRYVSDEARMAPYAAHTTIPQQPQQLQQFSPSAPPALFGLVSVDTAAPTPTTPSTTSTTSIAATSATTTTTTTAIPSTGVTITNVSSRMDPDRGGVIVIGSLPNKDYRHDEFNTSTKKFTFENGNFNAAAAKPADRIVSREINHKAIEQVEEVTMVEATPTKIVVKILGDKGALHFAQHFRGNSTVKQLVIHGPRKNAPKEHFIGHRGFYELLPCFAHLELLKIEGHKIGQEIGAFIADYLANNNQQLTTLDLWANQIEDATALVIVNSLKNMPSIRLINLGENLINTEAKLEIKKLARGSHFKVDMF